MPMSKNGARSAALIRTLVTLCTHHPCLSLETILEMQRSSGYSQSCYSRHSSCLMRLQYEMLVDKYAHQPRRRPEYELKTFYGQLQHIFSIQFPSACPDLGLNHPTNIILAAIRSCVLDNTDALLGNIDIRFYTSDGPVHVTDVTSLQCLVGRIPDRNSWAIIDRSRSLARACVEDGSE